METQSPFLNPVARKPATSWRMVLRASSHEIDLLGSLVSIKTCETHIRGLATDAKTTIMLTDKSGSYLGLSKMYESTSLVGIATLGPDSKIIFDTYLFSVNRKCLS